MTRLRYAGVVGTVGSGNMTNSATSHTFTAALTYANGVTVPTLTGSDYFMLSILDTSGNLSEVVKVTAYNSSTKAATLVRGQEGTSGVAHTSGDKVTMAVYASDIGQTVKSDVTSVYAYLGVAPSGTATSSSGWLVTRVTFPTVTAAAVFTTGTGAWDSRAGLTYS